MMRNGLVDWTALAWAAAIWGTTLASGHAQMNLTVVAAGQKIHDTRHQPLKDLNGYFPMRPIGDIETWPQRADELRRALRVALGLWPMPEATPAKAVIHGRVAMGGYSIEKVYFESLPGFFVTGNLYRPLGETNVRRPAVLTPHGHHANGRFMDSGRDQVRQQIVVGAERFEDGGRSVIQSRCVQLARMGCVVFHYDMIGYCDSVQISFEVAHRFAQQRPEMNDPTQWGLYSPQAESMLQSVMGLQTYNSIRALDWLASLPDVDPQRIAVTGASGGGTQTFILCALDSRPAISIPAVMVSTAMQGGCTCENASLLRVGTGNIDFASLFAPRPQCLISADDWTREMATKGFPELRQLYQQLNAADHLEHHPLLHFGHNYNYVSRAIMYRFVNQYLDLGLEEPIVEESYLRQSADQLTVWNEQHPPPDSGPDVERTILQTWHQRNRQQLDALRPTDAESLTSYQELVGTALDVILGRRLPDAGDIPNDHLNFIESATIDWDGGRLIKGQLQLQPRQFDPGRSPPLECLPTVVFVPRDWDAGRVTIWLTGSGKQGLVTDGALRPAVRRLLDAGVAVISADLSQQGEHRIDEEPLKMTRRVNNPREAAAYTLGYNDSLFAQRVHDVLSLVTFARRETPSPGKIWLVGIDGAGAWVAAARAQSGQQVARAAIDTQGFRFLEVPSIRHQHLLPGGAKYDDLPGMLAVAAPAHVWVAGETARSAPVTAAAYASVDKAAHLTWAGEEATADDVVAWLLAP